MKEPELIKINKDYAYSHNAIDDQLNSIWHYGFVNSDRTKVARKVVWIECGVYLHNYYTNRNDIRGESFNKNGYEIVIIFNPLLEPYDSFFKIDHNGEGFKLTELDSEKSS